MHHDLILLSKERVTQYSKGKSQKLGNREERVA